MNITYRNDRRPGPTNIY